MTKSGPFELNEGETLWDILDMRDNFLKMIRDMPTEVLREFFGPCRMDPWSNHAAHTELLMRRDYHTNGSYAGCRCITCYENLRNSFPKPFRFLVPVPK